jgi:hypothetical protein
MEPLRSLSLSVLAEIGPDVIKRFANIPKADGKRFDMLVRVEKDGTVRELFLCARTKVNRCLCETHAEGHAFATNSCSLGGRLPPGACVFLRCRL